MKCEEEKLKKKLAAQAETEKKLQETASIFLIFLGKTWRRNNGSLRAKKAVRWSGELPKKFAFVF
jgi:hypothetical protein